MEFILLVCWVIGMVARSRVLLFIPAIRLLRSGRVGNYLVGELSLSSSCAKNSVSVCARAYVCLLFRAVVSFNLNHVFTYYLQAGYLPAHNVCVVAESRSYQVHR